VKTDETFGERLKRLRKAQNITATELGAASGIEANSIFKLESGTSKEPGFLVGIRLCEALSVSPRELAFGKTRKPDISLRIGDTTVLIEIQTTKSVDAARRRAIVEMIGAALAKADGTMEVERLAAQSSPTEFEETDAAASHSKNVSETASLFRAVDELQATVSSVCDVLAQVQDRLTRLEGKQTKPSATPPRRKPR
jgi:transcriptional regulator with XRE-family HTH domain